MPATSRMGLRFVPRHRAESLPRHPVQRPCHKHHFARSRVRTALWARDASAGPARRRRAACSACSKRTAACHQSSTIVAPGSASRCSRHSPASPSHSTVAGVSARTLAAARPDTFTPDLAGSLNTLASMLGDLGRREPALAVAEEAVALYRTLAAARPEAFTPDLARALWVLGDLYGETGQPKPALAAISEAIWCLTPTFAAMPAAVHGIMAGL